ncbi:hypothetical protein DFH09DRAFT_224279 [Mycena vulgaris]|nr:hypothetical protein DFH09DRAFT_224279 [Mycena vulgaris]
MLQWSATITAGLGTMRALESEPVLVLDPERLEVQMGGREGAKMRWSCVSYGASQFAPAYAPRSSHARKPSTVLVLDLEGRGAGELDHAPRVCRPRGGDGTRAGVDLLGSAGVCVHPLLERQHRSWRWILKEGKGKPQVRVNYSMHAHGVGARWARSLMRNCLGGRMRGSRMQSSESAGARMRRWDSMARSLVHDRLASRSHDAGRGGDAPSSRSPVLARYTVSRGRRRMANCLCGA